MKLGKSVKNLVGDSIWRVKRTIRLIDFHYSLLNGKIPSEDVQWSIYISLQVCRGETKW